MRLSVLCQNSAVAVNHIMPPEEHGNNAPGPWHYYAVIYEASAACF